MSHRTRTDSKQRRRGRISLYIRRNHLGLVALFIALGGTAIAGSRVDSTDIAPRAVKSKHIAPGKVKQKHLARRAVGRKQLKPDSISGAKVADDALTGSDIDESTLSGLEGPPSGPAGGALAGTFPNPSIAANALTGSEVQDGSLTADDIDTSTLGSFPPSGPAGGALDGSFPNPDIADGSILPAHQAVIPVARARMTTDATVFDNVFTQLTFETEELDTADMYDDGGVEDVMTAPVDGV